MYLAQLGYRVDAVDTCAAALRIFRNRLAAFGRRDLISVLEYSLSPPVPFASDFYDVVLDMYVSCHLLDDQEIRFYWREIRRILKPGGLAVAAFLSTADEYYRRFLTGEYGQRKVVRDPLNDIQKRLYTEIELKRLFGSDFRLRRFRALKFEDIVLGDVYKREVFGLLLRK